MGIPKVTVDWASMQIALEFICRPPDFCVEATRKGILTIVLMIHESFRIRSVAMALDGFGILCGSSLKIALWRLWHGSSRSAIVGIFSRREMNW